MVKKNFCVFISGRGSNLKSIIEKSIKKNFPGNLILVISNKRHAKGLRIARKFNILTLVIEENKRILFEKKILKLVKKYKIRLICLAGFMQILSPYIINNFKRKIINIHPSLLPKFKGLNTHERALRSKEKFAGCTVHYVNKKIDTGSTILQKKVIIKKNDTVASLQKRVLKQEHLIYPKAIKYILNR